jgi:hypothetical protein
MSKNIVILFAVFTVCILSFRADAQDAMPIPAPLRMVVSATLSCLYENRKELGIVPPEFQKSKYKVKALLEKSSVEEPNNLHLLVYRPHGGAILFENHIEQKRVKVLVDAGEAATFTGKEERLIPYDLPAGLATHQRIYKLMRKIQTEPTFVIDRSEVDSTQKVCDWTP